MSKNRGGRPTVMTKEVLGKLEDAFMNAFTDEMACLYAGISVDALYDYCKVHPEFSKRKELLKKTPDLVAQKALVTDTKTVPGARWWAEHRMDDFRPKSEVKHSGSIETTDSKSAADARKIAEKYEDELRESIAKSA